MALVACNEDVFVIAGGYCEKCANRKLGILRTWSVDKAEVTKLVKNGVRLVRVIDEC